MKPSPVYVSIQNFQSIEKLEFEVSGFTCITGKTNIGKSSIMRAISGALLNKPVTNLIRKEAKSCSVQLRSKGWGLLWEKAIKGLNRYTIDGKLEKLENVGQRQPEPIADMGFHSVHIGDRDLYPWYASQWTPIFLLDEGGPTVTRFISEISGLDVLQNAIGLSLKNKKKALDEIKLASAELLRTIAGLEKVRKLDDLVVIVKELESQASSVSQYRHKISRCKEFYRDISETEAMIEAIDDVRKIKIPDDSIGKEIEKTLSMRRRHAKLEEAAKSVISLRGKMPDIPVSPEKEHETWARISKYKLVDRLKKSVSKLDTVNEVSLPCPINENEISKVKRGKEILEKIENLKKSTKTLKSSVKMPKSLDIDDDLEKTNRARNILSEIEKSVSDALIFESQLNGVNTALKEVMEELNAIPSCPTCNRPVTSSHIHTQ